MLKHKNLSRRRHVAVPVKALLSVVALALLLFVSACSTGGAKNEGEAKSAGASAAEQVAEGKPAPDFALPGDDGRMVKLSDYKGKQPVVLYFYPKDESPGCTKEACTFRDNLADFKKAGIEVLGVSVDSVEAHQKFKQKENLNFPLLSDEKKDVTKQYGVLGASGVANRVTFVIDKTGTVRKIYHDVAPAEHSAEALAFAKTLA